MAYDINSYVGNLGGAFATASSVMLETPSPLESNVALAPVSATVAVQPVSASVTTTSTVNSASTIDSGVRLTFANRLDSSADVCLNVNFGRLPPTRIRQPYSQRIGFRVLGVELFGVELCGELDTVVDDAPRRPALLGEARSHAAPADRGLRIRIGR